MAKKSRCSFRQPPAEHIAGTPDRWIVRCPCGMTFFGNTEEQAVGLWRRHATKEGKE